jgi:hypothetical protein
VRLPGPRELRWGGLVEWALFDYPPRETHSLMYESRFTVMDSCGVMIMFGGGLVGTGTCAVVWVNA